MDNNKQIEVRVLIQNLLGMPEHSVRPADTSKPISGNNYAIVQLTDMVAQGWAGGYKNSYQTTMATLTIDFMGDKSATYAQQLKMAMQTPYAIDTLFDLGMGFIDCSDPRNLTALELERVKRHQVRLQLSYEVQYDMPTTIPTDYQDHYQNEYEIETVPFGIITDHIPYVPSPIDPIEPQIWSPLDLFAGGKQGVWYDPIDKTTLFQDAKGLIVGGVNNTPVGLLLDRSKQLVFQEVVTITTNVGLPVNLPLYDAKTLVSNANMARGYIEITIDLDIEVGADLQLYIDSDVGRIGTFAESGIYTVRVNNNTPDDITYANLYIKNGSDFAISFTVNSLVIKRILGNHASQTVSAARPTYQDSGATSWLYNDKVDDALTVNLPAMTATVVTATDDGVAIDYPAVIAAGGHALTTTSTLGRDYGRIIIDRELTASEKSRVTDYFNAKR